MQTVTLADIQAARQRIVDGIYLSPCVESAPLSDLCGQIYCKLDYLQRTGSFKKRSARNALLLLDDQQKQHGVIAASAGNHALGLAYHGKLLGISVTVVMPKYAPLVKVTTCRKFRAHVVLEGESYGDSLKAAREMARVSGQVFLHGFDNPAIIAGQGTMGMEILEQIGVPDAIVAPIGGAGLIAGVALAVKSQAPQVKVFGVQAANAPAFTSAITAGQPVETTVLPTLADGLAVSKVGELSFAIARPLVERVVSVTEENISLAVLRLLELEKSIVEGAGTTSLAACLSNQLPELKGKRVALLLCGGNIDLKILDRIIERGLASDGRLCRFTAIVSDRPGGLAHLVQLIADAGASIKDIEHDRAFSGGDIMAVNVQCTVETADRQHIAQLYERLRTAGIKIFPTSQAVELSEPL